MAEGGCGSGWLCSGMQWLMGPMERSKMSEGRKREYCERESENEREGAQEIPKVSFGRREWNGMKRIILEYSSLPLFGSFNGGNGKSIPLFGSLSGREWNGYERTLIPLYSLKISNFHSPEIGRSRRE